MNKTEENTITLADSSQAFEKALRSGRLSYDPADSNYVNNYMYMHTEAGKDMFKHRDTRQYLPTAPQLTQDQIRRKLCIDPRYLLEQQIAFSESGTVPQRPTIGDLVKWIEQNQWEGVGQ
tara:strand:+ start:56 stop:415 length:360 start_codon:yes stop_codon:yes gene_type:complete